MPHGIVIYDDETVGQFKTTDNEKVLISFDTPKGFKNALELAGDNGLVLSMLETHEIED